MHVEQTLIKALINIEHQEHLTRLMSMRVDQLNKILRTITDCKMMKEEIIRQKKVRQEVKDGLEMTKKMIMRKLGKCIILAA
jgi:hypothetical protein